MLLLKKWAPSKKPSRSLKVSLALLLAVKKPTETLPKQCSTSLLQKQLFPWSTTAMGRFDHCSTLGLWISCSVISTQPTDNSLLLSFAPCKFEESIPSKISRDYFCLGNSIIFAMKNYIFSPKSSLPKQVSVRISLRFRKIKVLID